MIESLPSASVWDWFSTCLMIVGFTMLLVLSVYLTMCLLSVEAPEPRDEAADRLPLGWHTHEPIAS